jgi:hypothetical protein
MRLAIKSAVTTTFAAAVLAICCSAQSPASDAAAAFAPFEQWKNAVLAGDAAALKSFYSADPPAKVRVNTVVRDSDADVSFWLGLKPRSVNVEVVRSTPRHGHISYIFRAQVQPANGPAINLTDDQSWQQLNGEWRIISVERTTLLSSSSRRT